MTKILKTSPRIEYLKQESLRVESSPMLVKKYPAVKSMTVDLGYHDLERPARNGQIKYTVNLDNARAVFRIGCQNPECVRGDFDLTDVVAEAVRGRRTSVSNELSCQGWRSESAIDSVPCGRILRYKLTLGY